MCLGILQATGATLPFPMTVDMVTLLQGACKAVMDPSMLVILSLKLELEPKARCLQTLTNRTATTIKTMMRITMTATATAMKYSSRSYGKSRYSLYAFECNTPLKFLTSSHGSAALWEIRQCKPMSLWFSQYNFKKLQKGKS